MLKIKRIYDTPTKADGYRVLVDRLWPRGISKKTARIDLWMKEIAPSHALRKWFGHNPARWAGFQRRYRTELRAMPQRVAQMKGLIKEHSTVTLVFAARDEKRNQAAVLRTYLRRRK
jgi:uncharacterized protein YeaO (DUF488 family)